MVDNHTGEVGIEDHERGTVERVAASIEDLVYGSTLRYGRE